MFELIYYFSTFNMDENKIKMYIQMVFEHYDRDRRGTI